MSYHHLNFEDRTALMLESRKEGFSARKFAELIKRHPSTIYRELKRNSINDVYQARYASDNTFARRRRGHRKLKIDSILWKFIVEAIRCLWSPQQIAKRLKTFPDLDQTMNVREGANKRGNSSRLTQSFHFFMFEPIFSPVNALNQPI